VRADARFLAQPREFWANVRLISEQVGYTERGGQKTIKVPTVAEIRAAFAKLGLDPGRIVGASDAPSELGADLLAYYEHRASVLNDQVRPMLMDRDEAAATFDELFHRLRPKAPIPMNKQKGSKRAPAFLTGIVNMLIEQHAEGLPCNYDPRTLTSITRDGVPLRTLARRIDGAFTTVVDPIAVWEIKEYYYTTTFGSRVADGVYETLLDGSELQELRENEGIHIGHYLIVDDRYTWWDCGRSYLCRIIDMLNMGVLDEAIFGREALDRLPLLVKEWAKVAKVRAEGHSAQLRTQLSLDRCRGLRYPVTQP
jgi:hypothetical protein